MAGDWGGGVLVSLLCLTDGGVEIPCHANNSPSRALEITTIKNLFDAELFFCVGA
jgi:hypothetical protein